jgi:hypothetical protein
MGASMKRGGVLRYLLVLGAVFALLAAMPAASVAKKPPSFAKWSANEGTYESSLSGPVLSECADNFPDDDLQHGECLVAGLLKIWPGMNAHWQRGMTRITTPQKAACKKALRTYSVAYRANYESGIAYLRSHPTTAYTVFGAAVTSGTYKTLNDAKVATRKKALRICG